MREAPARALLERLGTSFWFVPSLMVAASMALAVLLVELDLTGGGQLAAWSPRLFGASAEGSRAMLSAIATSMITVAGVVFSITVVVLSQASSQYSPRVLRNFIGDRLNQAVLGVFVGVFAYCLVVLRTVRGDDGDGGFIPSVAVLAAMAYAFGAIGMLIVFIHHVAQAIQASAIVERITDETRGAIDRLFPEDMAEEPLTDARAAAQVPSEWRPIHSDRSGFVVAVDTQRLLRYARRSGRVVRLVPAVGDFVGDFVGEGAVLVEVGGDDAVTQSTVGLLRRCVALDRQRSMRQDAGFGLQQLVDVAVKALSPGINDPTTASLCIDRLGSLLARLAGRSMPGSQRMEDGRLRLLVAAPGFVQFLDLAFKPLLAHSRGDMQVLSRLVGALALVELATIDPDRRRLLLEVARDARHELRRVRPSSRAHAARTELRQLERRLQPGQGSSFPAPSRVDGRT